MNEADKTDVEYLPPVTLKAGQIQFGGTVRFLMGWGVAGLVTPPISGPNQKKQGTTLLHSFQVCLLWPSVPRCDLLPHHRFSATVFEVGSNSISRWGHFVIHHRADEKALASEPRPVLRVRDSWRRGASLEY